MPECRALHGPDFRRPASRRQKASHRPNLQFDILHDGDFRHDCRRFALRAAPVRVHAACVLVFADPKKILGTGARTPTKTPRRSFLPGNSGQRPLLTQPLNCPY